MITSGSQSCNRAQQARRAPALSTLLYWKQHLAYRCSQKSIEENVDPRLSTDLPVLLNQEDFLASPHSIVLEFARWISSSPTHEKDFNEAIRTATSHSTADLRDQNITYLLSFLDFLTMYLEWTPTEIVDGRNVYRQCLISYFVLNQPSVIDYQNKRYPGSSSEPSTWLSQWMISFGLAFGAYKDTPASMNEKSMATFRDATKFKVGDYMEPEAGRKTFNEFFSRRANPERRPIAAPEDSSVWTSPADCTYTETFPISAQATVTVKTLQWTVEELLDGSLYASRFAGGLLIHGFLGVFNYHRFHSPVDARVLGVCKASGPRYCIVDTMNDEGLVPASTTPDTRTVLRKTKIDCLADLGFDVAQTRGVVIFETPDRGLVAVIPVGMAQCSSVTLTVKPSDQVRKGEEFGYFQFGGSDAVLMFSKKPKIGIGVDQHLLIGEEFGT